MPSVRSIRVIEPSPLMLIALLLDGFPEPEAVSKIFYPDNIPVSAMRIWFGVSSFILG